MNNNILPVIFCFLLALSLAACGGGSGSGGGDGSGGSGGSTSGPTTGMISITGVDTGIVGDMLDTGFIASSLAAGGQPDHISIVDQNSTVSFVPPNVLIPDLADPDNGFVLNIFDDSPGGGFKGISMSIVVAGVKYDYVCTAPAATFIDCGATAISLDIGARTITLTDAAVENKATDVVHTLNGTLTW